MKPYSMCRFIMPILPEKNKILILKKFDLFSKKKKKFDLNSQDDYGMLELKK